MATTYPVKYINESMRGAPQVSGTTGTLLAAIRAFLITGFGKVTALSVSVSAGIATASLQPGQSFAKHCIVLVEGATPAELNGEARVLTTSNSSITWTTSAPDGVATGTITIKVAPVGGWEELFVGTAVNKGVFRSTVVGASGFCLRIDDTGTTTARVRCYESMTDIDTGTGPFPTEAQIAGGGHLWKSSVASAAPVRYDLAADARTILIPVAAAFANSSSGLASPIRGFGDMLPLSPAGDGFSVAISCASSAVISSPSSYINGTFDRSASGSDAIYMARQLSGLGGSQQTGSNSYVGGGNVPSGGDNTLGGFPSSVDGELKYSRRFIHAGDGVTPRAEVPGVFHIPQSGVANHIAPRDFLQGTGELAGRTLLALGMPGGSVNSPMVAGIALVDITGPWRPDHV